MTDPFDVLRSHVRSVALLEHPDTEPDDLVARITGVDDLDARDASVIALPPHRAPGSPGAARSPRRRRWLVAAGVSAVVVVGGAGVAAFVGARPSNPAADVLCRGSADGTGSAIAVAPGEDPIDQCADLWRIGDLPDVDAPGGPTTKVPRLVACTGSNGSIEVLPLPDDSSCADAGLDDADVAGALADPKLGLRHQLAREVNEAPCADVTSVRKTVERALATWGFSSWSITVRDEGATCARALIDPAGTRVELFPDPNTDTSLQETP